MKTSMNASVHFTIDFINHTITGSKLSFAKAGKGYGAEYEELATKIAAHPTFATKEKEPKHKSTKAKRTYNGLDYAFMESYIATLENVEIMLKTYHSVKERAEKAGKKVYPMTKKWFLNEFGSEEDGFDMAAAREAISNFHITQAKLTVVKADSHATENELKVRA